MAAPFTVVDSSVVVKWFLPETSHERALVLLRRYREQSIRLLAPALLMVEVGNVFCKRVRRRELIESSAAQAFQLLKINAPAIVDDQALLDDAMALALLGGQTVYDCLYLALALRLECDLITADRKFHSAMKTRYSNVTYL